ncbi:MAG: hypothetical protein AAB295_06770 [Chloroflexota bacterium]
MRRAVGSRRPAAGKAMPISVGVSTPQRRRFAAEAERRGLGVSSTIRALAIERLAEIERDEQLARARRWQGEQIRGVMARIGRRGFEEASAAEIDALFED